MLRDKFRKAWLTRAISIALGTGVFMSLPVTVPHIFPNFAVCTVEAKQAPVEWKLGADNMGGWKYGGKYGHKGKPELCGDKALGGSIRLSVDFSRNANDSWSEIKLENEAAGVKPLSIKGQNTLSFNLYFKPENMTQGGFKLKLYGKSLEEQEVINVCPELDLSKAKDAGNGMKCLPVQINFPSVDASLSYLCLSLVGSSTDYKGDLYIGQMKLSEEKVPDGFVDVKIAPQKQAKVQLNQLALPAQAALVDAQADQEIAQLFAYLQGIAASDKVLYGHQNELHKKVAKNLPGVSDTADMVGQHSAIMGLDALALTGNELSLTDDEKARGVTLSEKLADIYIPAAKQGAILTMSCHMPNFAEVAQRGKVNGKYDFSGYSPNNLQGNVMQRIMPGGDLHEVYNAYLDMVAEFDSRLQAANIPLLFRPFHENNGSWFWWGASSCTPSEYKNVFRYTVEYLRDVKGLHNMLYVYSPGGPLADEADYLSRYPGDAFIDVVGFDMYHRDASEDDLWMDGFAKTMKVVGDFATKHNKVAAVTETGMLYNNAGALRKSGNSRLNWWNEALAQISPQNMAYFMTWANFDDTNFDQPYMVSKNRGQELANGFIEFYNKDASVFMKESADFTKIAVKKSAAKDAYAYLLAPNSYQRVLGDLQLTARLGGRNDSVAFVIRDKAGKLLREIPAVAENNTAKAVLSKAEVSSLGAQIASVEVMVGDDLSDTVPVLLNMAAPVENPLLVDDFDNYYGDNGLLGGAYNANTGSGCTVVPKLSGEKHGGTNGLAFQYSINKGGYAGIVKSLKNANWSGCRGLQLWLKPDGMGQKLIIQLNSNGEDFEADLSQITKSTEPQLIILPFDSFKGKNGGRLEPANIKHFGIYCNTVGEKTVDSVMYFDDIQAVK